MRLTYREQATGDLLFEREFGLTADSLAYTPERGDTFVIRDGRKRGRVWQVIGTVRDIRDGKLERVDVMLVDPEAARRVEQ